MNYRRLLSIIQSAAKAVAWLTTSMVACSSSDEKGLAAGEACYFVGTSLSCDANAIFCYAAGTNSPCEGHGLCVGDGKGMLCARRCMQDADCSTTSATAVCMQDCPTAYVNGHCVEPAARDHLLSTMCTTWSSDTAGSAGVTD